MLAIPGYQIGEHLHTGSILSVYRARRDRDDRAVVLKVCANDPALPERIAWFQREYNLTRSLSLESAVQVYTLEISQ